MDEPPENVPNVRKLTKIIYSQNGEIFVNDDYLLPHLRFSARDGFGNGWLRRLTIENKNGRVIVYQTQPKEKIYKHETTLSMDDGILATCVCGWTHNFGFEPDADNLHKIVSSHVRPKFCTVPGCPKDGKCDGECIRNFFLPKDK